MVVADTGVDYIGDTDGIGNYLVHGGLVSSRIIPVKAIGLWPEFLLMSENWGGMSLQELPILVAIHAVIFLWFCPEYIGVGSGVALPIVIDKANGDEADILLCRVGAIVALRVESVEFLADKIVEILRHVIIQIVLLSLWVLMVPVGRLAKYQGLVVDESFAYLGDTEHRTVFVHHPGIHRGVDVEPFLQLLRPHRINHMALVVEWIGRHTGDIASWETIARYISQREIANCRQLMPLPVVLQ